MPANATAAVINLTAVSPTLGTYLQAYPSTSATPPNISNVNAPAGSVIPNLVTVQLGTTGAVRLRNHAGFSHVVADLFGYYAPDTDAANTFTPLTPARLLDTRSVGGPLAPKSSRTLKITGIGGIPTDATAVVLNVTAISGTSTTFVSVSPAASATVSNLNLPPRRVAPNLVTVQLSSTGSINFYNHAGYTHVIADVAGYYAPRDTGSRLVPVSPRRILDTRSRPLRIGPGGVYDVSIGTSAGAPAHVTAAVANVTGVTPSTSTYVQAFPTPSVGYPHPGASNLNLIPGEIRANLTVTKLGAGGDIRLRNFAGSLYLVADLAGYFVDPASPDYGSPPPTPTPYGVTCAAGMSNARPVQYTTTNLNLGTVAAADVSATAYFATGPVTHPSVADSGGHAAVAFYVGGATAGRTVPVVARVHSALLDASNACSTSFVPVAPPPLTCRATASPPNPAQYSNVDIIVTTLAGALATATFHYKTTTSVQSATANSAGRADILRNISGATVGYRVIVNVVVSLNGKSAYCSTSFIPRAR